MATTIMPNLSVQFPKALPLHHLRDLLIERYTFVYRDYDKTGDRDTHDYYAGMIDAYAEVATALGIQLSPDFTEPDEVADQMVRVDDLPREPVVAARAMVEYQMMGDFEGVGWAHYVLGIAVAEGHITDYNVLACGTEDWGLQIVQFTVDVPITKVEGMQREEAKDWFTTLANEIVGDSDCEVRWVGPVVQEAD